MWCSSGPTVAVHDCEARVGATESVVMAPSPWSIGDRWLITSDH